MKFKRRITKRFNQWISITNKLLGYGSSYGAYGAGSYGAYGARSFAAPALGYGNKYCKKKINSTNITIFWEKHLWNWVTLCSVAFSSLPWFSQFKQSFWMPFSKKKTFSTNYKTVLGNKLKIFQNFPYNFRHLDLLIPLCLTYN